LDEYLPFDNDEEVSGEFAPARRAERLECALARASEGLDEHFGRDELR
jgi:hypothetical protein